MKGMMHKKTNFVLETKKPARRGFWANFWASQLLVTCLGLGLLVLVAVPLLKNYAKQRAVNNEVEGIKKEIADFESKNKDLSEMLQYLQSKDSLEEQARLNLGLKKPGEKVVVISESSIASSSATSSEDVETGNLVKWWRYFFKH